MAESESDFLKAGQEHLSAKLVDDIYTPVISVLKTLFAAARNRFLFDIDQYSRHCANLLYFKTIASNDIPVYIDDIYVPLTLKLSGDVTYIVDNSFTVESKTNVVIKGLAGQGKSTILKKILINTIKNTSRTPIFFELKHYTGGSLYEDISLFLNNRGVKTQASYIQQMVSKSDTVFLLDAFDEVPPAFRERLLDQIGEISKKPCRLICTTRPDTEIDTLPIETFGVKELDNRQIHSIIRKSVSDSRKATSLIDALSRSKLHKEADGSVLKTPILVALLCVSYNLGEDIPETLSQFYKNIFDTVFFKHDNLKGRIKRERSWNDDRAIYLNIFEHFSYNNQRREQNSFNRSIVIERINSAMAYNNKVGMSAEKIFDEICDITNLIFEDGYNTYRYAHRSIQEFFAASFCSGMPEDKKKEFYSALNRSHNFHSAFNGVLFFLREIDYFAFCENYLIPQVSDLLELNNNEMCGNLTIPDNLLNSFCNNVYLKGFERKHRLQGSNGAVEKCYSGLFIENPDQFSVGIYQLFSCAISNFCTQESYKKQFFALNKQHGTNRAGEYSISVSKFNEHAPEKIPVKQILQNASLTLFGKAYNRALNDSNNRSKHLDEDDIFDFNI
jgi:energy-coupling factor transporter ATP-binding protein EcfA2